MMSPPVERPRTGEFRRSLAPSCFSVLNAVQQLRNRRLLGEVVDAVPSGRECGMARALTVQQPSSGRIACKSGMRIQNASGDAVLADRSA
ncbi:hypothetical protein GCM10010446_24410 [Streptomyces enissocaesilis]|uniref:Uncharacterized protein n=1 Tax=Streptomyces enissocaesilis TaxID=332589 RepID=A0ABP6JRE5_9ACTN